MKNKKIPCIELIRLEESNPDPEKESGRKEGRKEGRTLYSSSIRS
jgi:hypothetical protein